MKEDFNVANPTKENIEWAIKNLLFFVTAFASLDQYKEYHKLCNNVLIKINKVLPTYFNTGSLKAINEEDLMDIHYDLLDLEVETQLNGFYGEWSLLWIDALITLRQSEINLGGIVK